MTGGASVAPRNIKYGYTVADKTAMIDIQLVSPTRRAAMINWLAVRIRLMTTTVHTDQDILDNFNRHAPKWDAVVIPVKVEALDGVAEGQ